MDTNAYIAAQLTGATNMMKALLADVTEAEWRSRPAPGQNLFGFTAWHMPATQDWALRVALRGLPMLGSRAEWASRGLGLCPIPFGMPAAEADAVAMATTPADVLAYAGAVLEDALAVLSTLDAAALDAIPPASYRLSHSDVPAYREVTANMEGWPAWRLFASPSTGHVRGHLGELDLVKAMLRR